VPYVVAFAALADFADGLFARLLDVYSELGKQLDSLADLISFGMVPGAIFFFLLQQQDLPLLACLPAFLLTAFSALRLGKFNLDERQQKDFIGLPTPACTLFTLGLLGNYLTGTTQIAPAWLLYLLLPLLCYLLIAELPMFSLKFNALRWSGNEIKIIFAIAALLLLLYLKLAGLIWVIPLYVLISLLRHWQNTKN